MVGLVNAKVVVKTLHEMLKERTKEGAAQEEALARQFVKRMRTETKDREKVKEEAKRLDARMQHLATGVDPQPKRKKFTCFKAAPAARGLSIAVAFGACDKIKNE